jgi:hypothetical protein
MSEFSIGLAYLKFTQLRRFKVSFNLLLLLRVVKVTLLTVSFRDRMGLRAETSLKDMFL